MSRTRSLCTCLLLGMLAGCGPGYAVDYLRPKLFLVGPELTRYGLAPADAQCVGRWLSENLTVWELRQLATVTRAIKEGKAGYPDRLSPKELVWAGAHVEDDKVPLELERAFGHCGVSTAVEAPGPVAEASPEPAEAPPGSGPENGPKDYQPADELLRALEAYERGDFGTAARLAEAAAAAGDSGAQQFLGGLYAYGQGLRKDAAMAASWYAKAAEQGWSEAMHNLGKAYETGSGVPRDPVEALKWYLLASARPTEDPAMVEQSKLGLLAGMSVADIEKAANLARQWEQAHRQRSPAP